MPCKSCGGRTIRTNNIQRAVAPQSTLNVFKDSDFKTVYYIGVPNVPIIGTFTGIAYGLRPFGSRMLLHINDFNPENFSYEEPQIPEPVSIAQIFERKPRKKKDESETDI